MQIEDVTWKVKLAGHFKNDEVWIDELSKLRAELLYDHGKRPAFLRSSGEYYDRDEFDIISTHILAYIGEKLIGAVRILPLKDSSYQCISSTVVGHHHFKTIIQELFPSIDIDNIVELNRLVVHPEYRDMRLGVYLCAAAFVLSDDLNYFSIANGNIHLLSTFHLKHLGGILYPKYAGPYSSTHYNDNEIYLVYFDKNLYSPFFKRQMNMIRKLIPFEKIENILKMTVTLAATDSNKFKPITQDEAI